MRPQRSYTLSYSRRDRNCSQSEGAEAGALGLTGEILTVGWKSIEKIEGWYRAGVGGSATAEAGSRLRDPRWKGGSGGADLHCGGFIMREGARDLICNK